MQVTFAILSILLITHLAHAQESKTLHKNSNTIQSAVNKIPDANLTLTTITDTLKISKLDSLAAIEKIDTLRTNIAQKEDRIITVTDSIQKIINLPEEKIDQVNRKIQSHADSLMQPINKPIDKVNNEITKKQQSVENKVNGVEEKVQGKADGVQNNLDGGVKKATDGEVKLPSDGVNIPEHGTTLPMQDIGLNNAGLPDSKLPGLDGGNLKSKTEVPKLPDTNLDVKSISEKAVHC